MGLENRVKEHRARLNINQSKLGELAHVSRQTISLIERGELAKIFGVSVEDIFQYEEDETDDKEKL
mgnify:CR=1 FL=1